MKSGKLFTKITITSVYLLLSILIILKNVDPLFTTVIMVWLSVFTYSLFNVEKNIVLLSFLITFFTFLLGRETFYYFGNVGKYWVFQNPEVNSHTYLALLIAIICVYLGFLFKTTFISFKNYSGRKKTETDSSYRLKLRYVTRLGYMLTYIFLILAVFFQIRYVQRVGYVESYQATDSGAGVPWIISKLSLVSPMLFYFFLATKPTKEEARLPIRMYLFYGMFTLLTGQRFPVMSVVMLIGIYYVIRNRDESWIEKRHIVSLILFGPIAVTGLFLVDSVRLNRNIEYSGFADTFFDFFRVQGGSINVIKYSYYFHDYTLDVRFYSFSSIINNILNLNPYHGNSMDNALYGTSMAARMSYLVYGKNAYLAGRGVGSSFIAELYHDFGYLGIGIGSFIYGQVLQRISNMTFLSPLKTVVQIAMISPLLLSPRGEFDGFIGLPFRRGNVMVVILVIIMTNLLYRRYQERMKSMKVGIYEN